MTESPARFPPNPRRKARIREIARTIIAKDRSDRKHGLTVDTAGAVAQALERVYRDGVRDGPAALATMPEQSATGPVEWALIPPRPREAFWSICLSIMGGDGRQSCDGHLVPAITERDTPGWTTVTAGRGPDQVIGARSIGPLIRLYLLEQSADPPLRLFLTERGRATCLSFCERGGRYSGDLTAI